MRHLGSSTCGGVLVGLTLLVVVSCGEAGGGSAVGETLPPVDLAATTLDGHTAPSTTLPVQIEDRGCAGAPVEVAERILIERRRGQAAPTCLPTGPNPVGDPVDDAMGDTTGDAAGACWSRCPDGRVFVDFDLDTTRAPTKRTNATSGAEETIVSFAARYSTGDGTTTSAEALVLQQSDAGDAWQLVELVEVDVAAKVEAAQEAAIRYFAAIRLGDFRAAAGVMTADSTATTADRDDLRRLADEGMLSGTTIDEIASGLEHWCASGAECTREPTLEIEVTAAHEVRIIATYQLDVGTYETTFAFVDGVLEGLPVKVG